MSSDMLSPDWIRAALSRVRQANMDRAEAALVDKGAEFLALCPFHEEKTPSFVVHRLTGAYRCLSCGAVGTVAELAVRTEPAASRVEATP